MRPHHSDRGGPTRRAVGDTMFESMALGSSSSVDALTGSQRGGFYNARFEVAIVGGVLVVIVSIVLAARAAAPAGWFLAAAAVVAGVALAGFGLLRVRDGRRRERALAQKVEREQQGPVA